MYLLYILENEYKQVKTKYEPYFTKPTIQNMYYTTNIWILFHVF